MVGYVSSKIETTLVLTTVNNATDEFKIEKQKEIFEKSLLKNI